jgi:uncharacterized protein
MNPVNHFEITFDDKDRAMKFYKNVFGWKMMDMPEMRYVVVQTTDTDDKHMPKKPGAINGGMTQRDDTAKSPIIVVTVESIEDKISRIKSEGGSVVFPKVEVGDMGFYARVKDSEKNVIGLWEDKK